MPYTIRKTFRFEAAHRLMDSYSKKCQQVHGHSYKLELFLQSDQLDENEMVVDFGKLRDLLGDILEQFDHRIVLCEKDPLTDCLPENLGCILVSFNPTAEKMADYFFHLLRTEFYQNEDLRHIQIKAVRIHETETGWAEYSEN